MMQIESPLQLSPLITAQFQRGILTNTGFAVQLFEKEIQRGTLFAEELPGALLLFRRRSGFDRLNFYLQPTADLTSWQPKGTVVLEIPSRPRDIALRSCEAMWAQMGFRLRFRRIRMTRTEKCTAQPLPGYPVRFALEDDLAAVRTLMESAYDPLTACFPTDGELLEDIRSGFVVLAEHDGSIAAFLRIPQSKKSAEVRHLATAPPHRGLGLAQTLFAFADQHSDAEKTLLWVAEGNTSALRLYNKLGFTPDSWTSGVWVYQEKGTN